MSLVPLIILLVFTTALSPGGEVPPDYDRKSEVRMYTDVWDPLTFDEVLWRTLEGIAEVEEFLPLEVKKFQVEIRSSTETYPAISFDVDRSDLVRFRAGYLKPEVFIRVAVKFN